MELGVYVHVPFCARRCDYCDFATSERAELADAYVDACVADLDRRRDLGSGPATSVFFGGGTPSLLRAERLVAVLDAIPRTPGAEVTVECNPDSVDPSKLRAYAAAGVTRVSFGMQSARPRVLAALGRTHDPADVPRAVDAARAAGIDHVNVDVIYGAPAESDADWIATLDAVVALDVDHVSAYALTVERATPLGARVAAGTERAPDDDVQARRHDLADERLGAAGLEWYELSNWARPGGACRHNLLTWAQGDYIGIGCAAHSHVEGRRWWNVRTPQGYIERVREHADPIAGEERLDAAARAEEAVVLGLRTRHGVPEAALPAGVVGELSAIGLALRRDGRVVLTRAGRRLAGDVTARLLAAGVVSTR